MKSQPVRSLADTSAFVMTCHNTRMAGEGQLRPELRAAVGKVLAACDAVPVLPEPMAATVAAIREVHAKARPQWLIDLEEYEAADAKLKLAQAELAQYRADCRAQQT